MARRQNFTLTALVAATVFLFLTYLLSAGLSPARPARTLKADDDMMGPAKPDNDAAGPLEADHGMMGPVKPDNDATGPAKADPDAAAPSKADSDAEAPIDKKPAAVPTSDPKGDFKIDMDSMPDLSKGDSIAPKMENATLKAELGRATWKFLHTMVARFPDKPSENERKTLDSFFSLFGMLYPCSECARHFREMLEKYPPQTSSRNAAAGWLCATHNMVNKRLGKPQFDCTKIGDFYDCGCGDDKKGGGKKDEDEGEGEGEGEGETAEDEKDATDKKGKGKGKTKTKAKGETGKKGKNAIDKAIQDEDRARREILQEAVVF